MEQTEIEAALRRIEAKLDKVGSALDVLLAALAEDGDEEPPQLTLDGMPAGAARDALQSL